MSGDTFLVDVTLGIAVYPSHADDAATLFRRAELALKAAESKQRSLAVTAEGDGLFWVRAPRAGTETDKASSAADDEQPCLVGSSLSRFKMPPSRAKRGGGLALHPAKPPGLPTTASRAGPLQRSM